jgi:transglutaminase-like putative cysteine protease
MSLLTVQHSTVYRYREPVGLGEHRMMFRPRESHDLRLIQSKLLISPQPVSLRWLHDPFDNSVAVAAFSGKTTELRFESSVTLEHFENAMPDYQLEDYARTYPFRYTDEDFPALERALARRHIEHCILEWALQFLDPAETTGALNILRAMTRSIRKDFVYSRRMEKGVQSPVKTLETHRGSCRDFAVLMIEGARALGIAARFVSGYIYTPAGSGLAGGGATHAWMQAYLPGAGWIDFDPTNSIIGNRNLIRVGVSWTPEHVLPLWGTYFGSADAYIGMEVSVAVSEQAVVAA